MSIFLRKQRSKIKQRIKIKRNINRSLTYGENKLIIKIQNTNNHIYVRLIRLLDRKVLSTFSTIKHSKDKSNNLVYKMQMIPSVAEDLVNSIKELDLINEINKSSIIWDTSGGSYRGRIKCLIDSINSKLDIELNKNK